MHMFGVSGDNCTMMQTQTVNWHVFDSAEALTQGAFDAVAHCAEQAIAARGSFQIALAGGFTPGAVYRQLSHLKTDWSKWHVYFGDERCLPPDDDQRNSLMASRAFLDLVPIPSEQIYVIPAELGASEGAAAYSRILEGTETFDLVLLGLGEDGHTASLFPGHAWEHHPPAPAIPVMHAPKPPSERISMSASRLSNARRVIFLVSGEGKRHAISQWRSQNYVPGRAIVPNCAVDVFLDKAAHGPD